MRVLWSDNDHMPHYSLVFVCSLSVLHESSSSSSSSSSSDERDPGGNDDDDEDSVLGTLPSRWREMPGGAGVYLGSLVRPYNVHSIYIFFSVCLETHVT
jgi:hypothetical protein